MAVITYREALNQALAEEMERDPDVFLMGEEVGVYNGAYKVSKGLLDRFGEMRVVDTPITELGFAGLGVGAAMTGLRPVIEFMTWNFAILAFDQIFNSAAKMRSMSGGQFKMPVTFRGPTGAALQLAAQHSQALEARCAHYPGSRWSSPARRPTPRGCSRRPSATTTRSASSRARCCTTSRARSRRTTTSSSPRRGGPQARGRRRLDHHPREDDPRRAAGRGAAREGRRQADVLDLRSLRPLDTDAILATVAKTNRVVLLEEGWPYGGITATIAALIQEEAFDHLDAPSCASPRPTCRCPTRSSSRRREAERRAGGRGEPGEPGPLPIETKWRRKVYMEALSPTMEEGRLVTWLKNEGDEVKEGDVLAEVETDKATMELVARGSGVLRKRWSARATPRTSAR
jgi:pyruvate dehydrogenase E1 component beta subunit